MGLPQAEALVASAGADGSVLLWDARQVRVVSKLSTNCATYALAVGADMLLSAGYDGKISAWELRSDRLSSTVQAHRAPIRALQVVNCSVWSGSTDGTIRSLALGQLLSPRLSSSPGNAHQQALQQYILSGRPPPPSPSYANDIRLL